MKQYLQIIWICMKRILKRPVYLVLFLLMPVVSMVVVKLWTTDESGPKIGIYIENRTENEQILPLLEEKAGIFEICQFDTLDMLKRAVLNNDVDCGFSWKSDLLEQITIGNYTGSIECYLSPETRMVSMAKEKVAACVFQVYSEKQYRIYESAIDEAYAWEKYKEHLYDGLTFQFTYEGGEHVQVEEDVSNVIFPLRGILAVFVFMISLCSVLDYTKERQMGRLVNLRRNSALFVGTVFIPTILAGQMSLISLWIGHDVGNFFVEEMRMFLYAGVLLVYGCFLSIIIGKKEQLLLAAIPILGAISFIIAPVFIDLSGIIPAVKVARWLVPVTYYLIL